MIILDTSTITQNYVSKWVNGDGKQFDNLASFKDAKAIKNWAIQIQWNNVVGTADAEINIYSTLEKKKTLEKTSVISTISNVDDALIIDMSGIIVAGFCVEIVLNSVTSIDVSIDAIFD